MSALEHAGPGAFAKFWLCGLGFSVQVVGLQSIGFNVRGLGFCKV